MIIYGSYFYNVYLQNEGETFEFPDLFKKDTDVGKQLKQESDMMNQRQIQNTQDWHEKDIPPWYRK